MRGTRMTVARRKAEKTFKKYEGFSPRNENQPGWYYSPRTRWTKDELERVFTAKQKFLALVICVVILEDIGDIYQCRRSNNILMLTYSTKKLVGITEN